MKFGSSAIVGLAAVVAMGVMSIAATTISPVSAADRPQLLTGANIIEVEQGPLSEQLDGKRELVQGTREGNICRFKIGFHADGTKTRVQMASVVAVDPDSCAVEIERGTVNFSPSSLVPAGTTDSLSADVPGSKQGSRAADDDVGGEGVNTNRKATFWYFYDDPIGLHTNYVRNSVRTNAKKGQIQNAKCSRTWDKLDESGWNRDTGYAKFDCNATKNKAVSVAREHFYNDTFLGPLCSGRDRTHTYYVGNTAKATLKDIDGYIEQTWDSGGCATILTGISFFEENTYYGN